MPHSARWQVAAAALIGLGAATLLTSQLGLALALLTVGTAALGTTVARLRALRPRHRHRGACRRSSAGRSA